MIEMKEKTFFDKIEIVFYAHQLDNCISKKKIYFNKFNKKILIN